MAYFKIEMDSDYITSEEAKKLLRQITPIKTFSEITESEFIK